MRANQIVGETLSAANDYAARGFNVFPCWHGKKTPATTNGFKDASDESERLTSWFSSGNHNIAIATGEKSKVAAIDVDTYAGGTLTALESELGELPPTLEAKTRAGGRHLLFRYPEGALLRSFNGQIAPSVDLKAEGGYIIAAPSWVAADDKGPAGQYKWVNDLPVAELPVAWRQRWESLGGTKSPTPMNNEFAGLAEAYVVPERIDKGQRNSAVLAYVGHVRKKGMPETLIRGAALDFNIARCVPPLDEEEVASIVSRYEKPALDDPTVWPDTRELPPKYPAPPSINTANLPTTLAPYVDDSSARLQVSPEMIAVPVLVSFGSVIGKKFVVQPKANDLSWTESPTFWAANVAPPAFLKSPSQDAGSRFIREMESKAMLEHGAEMVKWASESRVRKLQIETENSEAKKLVKQGDLAGAQKLLDSVAEITPPVRVRFIIQDTTPEARLDILAENPNGVMQLSDELDGHIATLKREGHEASRAQELQFHDGKQDYATDRIKRGSSVAEAPRMSLYGSLQPAKVEKYLRDLKRGGNDDGYFQRLTQLGIWPTFDSNYTLTDVVPDAQAEEQARAVFKAVDAMPLERDPLTGRITPKILKFDAAAQAHFNKFLIDLENRIRQGRVGGPLMASHVGKYRGTLPKLALVIALAENPAATCINANAFARAQRLLKFFHEHAKRIYAVESRSDIVSAHELLGRIRKGQVANEFATRDVQRREWDGLTTSAEMEGAVAILREHGYLREEIVSTEGRSRRILLIHPDVLPTKTGKAA